MPTAWVPTWTPHPLAASLASLSPAAALAPLQRPCTLLRVTWGAEAGQPSTVAGAPAVAATVVAEWPALSRELSATDAWRHGAGLHPPRGGAARVVVLRESAVCGEDTSHSRCTAATPHCAQVSQRAPSLPRVGGLRLQLGDALHAADWRFLVSRHASGAGTAASAQAEVAGADLEALAAFFPAVHHGRYYRTPHVFVQHCRHSDEHLLWCEEAPLFPVSWNAVATRSSRHRSSSSSSVDCDDTRAAAVLCSASVHRKRRRRWLAQQPRGHRPATRRLEDEGASASLDEHTCVYSLTPRGWRGAAVAGEGAARCESPRPRCETPPGGAAPHAEPMPTYAPLYWVLRAACRSELRRSALHEHTDEVLKAASAELLQHGVAASLAQWFAAVTSPTSGGPVLVSSLASAADATALVAALMRDWWRQLSEDSHAEVSTEATIRGGRRHSYSGRKATALRCALLHYERMGGHASDPAAAATAAAAAAFVPRCLAQLCVACAEALTHACRAQERAPGRSGAHSRRSSSAACAGPLHRERRTSVSVAAADDAGASAPLRTRQANVPLTPAAVVTAAACRLPQASLADSRRRKRDYSACMDLVLHFLFTEQQQQLLPCSNAADTRV